MNVISRARRFARPLWSEGRGWVLLFVALGWFLTIGTRYVFPAMFPHLRTAFGFNLSTLGALYTLLWATYAVGQFPAGLVSDHIGIHRVLSYSAFLSAVAMLFIGAVTTPVMLVVGVVLFGATSSLYGPSRFTILARIYEDHSGTAIGLTQACGQIGNTVLPALAGIIATLLFWQAGFLFIIPLFLLVGIGIWLVIPEADEAGDDSDESPIHLSSLRTIVAGACFPRSLVLAAVLMLTTFVIQGLTGFYPTYLVQVKGYGPSTAATVYALLFVSAGAVQPLTGVLNDQLGTPRALLITVGVLAVSLPLVTVAGTVLQLAVVTVLIGGSLFGIGPIALSRLTNVLPTDIRGTGLGLLRTVYFLVGSTGSFVVGTMADRALFDESFLLFAALAVGIFAFAVTFGRLAEK